MRLENWNCWAANHSHGKAGVLIANGSTQKRNKPRYRTGEAKISNSAPPTLLFDNLALIGKPSTIFSANSRIQFASTVGKHGDDGIIARSVRSQANQYLKLHQVDQLRLFWVLIQS